MPLDTLTKDVWTAVTTTTADTVFHNRSSRPIYITSEDTTALPIDEGLELLPGDAVVFGTGLDIEASIHDADGVIFYTVLT